MTNNPEKSWTEYLRFITPILITICLFYLNSIDRKVDCIDDKLFKHLTNDDLHPPKTLIVTKAEFVIYQDMRQRQMDEIRNSLNARFDGLRNSVDRMIDRIENPKLQH